MKLEYAHLERIQKKYWFARFMVEGSSLPCSAKANISSGFKKRLDKRMNEKDGSSIGLSLTVVLLNP